MARRKVPYSVKRIMITPTKAVELLENMVEQRKVSDIRVGKIQRDLENGRWKFNGDPIRCNEYGKLFDGQHRLWACVNADTPIEVLMIVGLNDKEVNTTIDVNQPRSFADHLAIHRGKGNAKIIETASRLLWAHHATGRFVPAHGGRGTEIPSYDELEGLISKETRLAKYAGEVQMVPQLVSKGQLLYCMVLLARVSREDAESFLEAFTLGKCDEDTDHQIWVLRRRLFHQYDSRTRMSRSDKIAMVIKAWNLWRTDSEIQKLYVTDRDTATLVPI